MAGERAGFIQAEPCGICEQEAGSAGRLLPEVLYEGLPENHAQETAHLVYDSREQRKCGVAVAQCLSRKSQQKQTAPRVEAGCRNVLLLPKCAAVARRHGSDALLLFVLNAACLCADTLLRVYVLCDGFKS